MFGGLGLEGSTSLFIWVVFNVMFMFLVVCSSFGLVMFQAMWFSLEQLFEACTLLLSTFCLTVLGVHRGTATG